MAFYSLQGPCGFISEFVSEGGGAPSFRTWDELEAFLAVQPLGTLAELAGVGVLPIVRAVSDGAGGVEIIGDVVFTRGDGSEFTIGAGLNFSGLDGVDPTLDATGLDVSLIEGEGEINFFTVKGHLQSIEAEYQCSIPAEVDNQAVAIGSAIFGGGVAVYAGVGFDAGDGRWHRRAWRGSPPVLLNTSSPVSVPAGSQLVFNSIASNSLNISALQAGAWDATDPPTSVLQPSLNLFSARITTAPRKLRIYCEGKAAAGFSAKITALRAKGARA